MRLACELPHYFATTVAIDSVFPLWQIPSRCQTPCGPSTCFDRDTCSRTNLTNFQMQCDWNARQARVPMILTLLSNTSSTNVVGGDYVLPTGSIVPVAPLDYTLSYLYQQAGQAAASINPSQLQGLAEDSSVACNASSCRVPIRTYALNVSTSQMWQGEQVYSVCYRHVL
jgi:hypothetical protein